MDGDGTDFPPLSQNLKFISCLVVDEIIDLTDLRSDQPYTIPPARQAAISPRSPVTITTRKPVTRPQQTASPASRRTNYDFTPASLLAGRTLNLPPHLDKTFHGNRSNTASLYHGGGARDFDFLARSPSTSRTTINIQGGSDVSISFSGRPSVTSGSPAAVDLTRAPKASGGRPHINQVIVNLLDTDSQANKNRPPGSPQILSASPAAEPPRKDSGLNINCGICLDKITQPAATPCGHVFCYPCLSLSQRSQKQCPLCRKPLSVRQIHKLFI